MEGEAVITIYFIQRLFIQDSYSHLHLPVTEAEFQSSPGDINDRIRHDIPNSKVRTGSHPGGYHSDA